MPLVAAAAVAAAGSVAAGAIQAGSAGDAAQAQIDAINNAPKLDINKTQSDAKEADLQRFQNQFAAQEKYDPQSAAMRTGGAATILNSLAENGANSTAADKAVKDLQTSADTDVTQNGAVISQLIDRAKSELAAGATLPPEFQSELVRSGLEDSSASGNSLNAAGAAGSNLRTLLGSAGENLKNQRQGVALQALSGASDLQKQRANILSNIVTMDASLRGQKFSQGLQANAVGNSNLPSVGLTGSDVASLGVAKVNQGNAQAQQIGAAQAQKELSKGQLLSSIVGGGTSLLSSGLSKFGSSPSATLTASDLTPVTRY